MDDNDVNADDIATAAPNVAVQTTRQLIVATRFYGIRGQ